MENTQIICVKGQKLLKVKMVQTTRSPHTHTHIEGKLVDLNKELRLGGAIWSQLCKAHMDELKCYTSEMIGTCKLKTLS